MVVILKNGMKIELRWKELVPSLDVLEKIINSPGDHIHPAISEAGLHYYDLADVDLDATKILHHQQKEL